MKINDSIPKTERKIFTLIELLVVIAIIAILASMLLPALTKARAMGQMANCTGKIKQLGNGYQMYVDDNSGWLLLNRRPKLDAQGKIEKLNGEPWTVDIAPYVNEVRLKTTNYYNPKGIFSCPSMTGRKAQKSEPQKEIFNKSRPEYGLNRTGPGGEPGYTNMVRNQNKVLVPTRLFVFGDSYTNDFEGHVGCLDILPWGHVDMRHNAKANFCYMDGHVQSHSAAELKYPLRQSAYQLPWGNTKK